MERPEPIRMQSTDYFYPEERVEEFKQEHGSFGALVLDCFNEIDPLGCGMMPYEYLGYAKRFIENLLKAQVVSNRPETPELFIEVVRRCFYPTQVAEGIVSPGVINTIALTILEIMPTAGLTLDTSKWPQNV